MLYLMSYFSLAEKVGLEPTTYRLDRFAVSIPKLGAGDRSRTDDIYLGKVMLYQLSYTRIV